MAFRSGNPALTSKTFEQYTRAGTSADPMTIEGTVDKTGFLLFLLIVSASWPWTRFFGSGQNVAAVMPFIWGGAIGGLVLALITVFKKTAAPITGPLYAVAEGLALGGLSAYFEAQFHLIVIQAVGLTFGTLAALLIAYRTGLIKATENFKLGVVAATGGIALFYIVALGLGFFGIRIGFLHEGTTAGILFSVFVVIIAALNLVLDFDFIESGVEAGAPKWLEWYAAFGLLVTLVWLYLEILRLLAKSRSRR